MLGPGKIANLKYKTFLEFTFRLMIRKKSSYNVQKCSSDHYKMGNTNVTRKKIQR